ncbi:MAG: phosphoribosyltransferase [Phycisphaerae bacterium]
MIPKIIHSRSQLLCHLNEYEDGARTLFVLADTYPELFDFHCPNITQLAPKGWRVSKSERMKYLWFPSGSLGTADLTRIEEWKQHFEQYVLIGLSRNIAPGFNQELNFCMGLSFNYDPNAKTRTPFGEALYQAKYQSSKNHFAELTGVMATAVALLPIPPDEKSNLLVSSVPSDPGSDNFGRKLAAAVAAAWRIPFAASGLLCNKSELKNLQFMEKVKQWCDLYESGQCVTMDVDVKGKTVVIIDDLCQSGITLWCYAMYLKNLGAKYVLGLVCVKSLRDTDNL